MKQAKGHPDKLQLGGTFVAFTLGLDSDVDQVLVNGHIVAAGRITFLETADPRITNGRRLAGAGSPIAQGQTTNGHTDGWIAHVIGFECYEEIHNPGPRPNRSYRHIHPNCTAAVDGGPEAFIVPFYGRRHARIIVSAVGGDRADFYVDGVQQALGVVIGSTDLIDYLGDDFYGIHLVGTPTAPIASDVTASDEDVVYVGPGKHVGGTDSAEAFEALIIYYGANVGDGGGGGGACDIIIDVEVGGEWGVG